MPGRRPGVDVRSRRATAEAEDRSQVAAGFAPVVAVPGEPGRGTVGRVLPHETFGPHDPAVRRLPALDGGDIQFGRAAHQHHRGVPVRHDVVSAGVPVVVIVAQLQNARDEERSVVHVGASAPVVPHPAVGSVHGIALAAKVGGGHPVVDGWVHDLMRLPVDVHQAHRSPAEFAIRAPGGFRQNGKVGRTAQIDVVGDDVRDLRRELLREPDGSLRRGQREGAHGRSRRAPERAFHDGDVGPDGRGPFRASARRAAGLLLRIEIEIHLSPSGCALHSITPLRRVVADVGSATAMAPTISLLAPHRLHQAPQGAYPPTLRIRGGARAATRVASNG